MKEIARFMYDGQTDVHTALVLYMERFALCLVTTLGTHVYLKTFIAFEMHPAQAAFKDS